MEKGGANMAHIEANVGIRSSGPSNRQQEVYPNLDGLGYATRCIAEMFTEGYRPADLQLAALNSQRWTTEKMQDLYINGSRQ